MKSIQPVDELDVLSTFNTRFEGSTVVDASGKPLRVYHGTPVGERNGLTIGDISLFDRLFTQKMFGRAPGIDQVGSWFSDSPGSDGAGKYTPDTNGVIYPVYLAIKNPWEVSVSGLKRQMNKHSGAPMDDWNSAKPTETGVDQLRAWMKDVGFDGIKILHDPYSENGSTEFENQTVWIALEPEQITFALGIDLDKALDLSSAGVRDDSDVLDVPGRPVLEAEMHTSELKRVDVFVSNENMGAFLRRVESIQAMARKLDLPLWEVVIGDKEWRPCDAFPIDLYPGRLDAGPLQIEGCSVSITGHAPVLAGWRFLAKIEHGEGGNLVKRMVGGDDSPAEWHTCGPDCDHCEVSRDRKNTYMLQSVDTGEVKHVGSTCMQDFLGQDQRDPERIAAMFDRVTDLDREFEDDPDIAASGRMSPYGVAPDVLMTAVLKIVQEDGGYLSTEKAESLHCLSTGERLRAAFWDKKPIVVTPDVGHVERAQKVVAWLQEQKTVNSLWLRNIAYLADRPCVTYKDAGLLASGYVAWSRDVQKQVRSERGAGDWIGAAGEKTTKSATLERQGSYENAYGVVSVLSFRDEEGNGMVWKTQSPPRGLVVGSAYHVSATIKAHGEYAGEKQTEIIRAKVAELELFSFGALPGFKKCASLATPDIADDSGHTPLLKAVWEDQRPHAVVLLSNGADANQLNQNEVPVLAYATSVEMAQTLLGAGARAADVSDEWLQGMLPEVRAVVVAAIPVLASLDADLEGEAAKVVREGAFSGRVMEIDDGVMVQRVNRDGRTVQHEVSKLSLAVAVGDVVDISYKDGAGVVSNMSKGVGVER